MNQTTLFTVEIVLHRSAMETQGLSMPSLEEGEVPAEMTVSVEEQTPDAGTIEVTEIKHSPEKKRRMRVYSQK